MSKHAKLCSNITKTNYGPILSAANITDMTTTHAGTFHFPPDLSQQVQQGNILNCIATGSLISTGKLCNVDCIVIFTKHYVDIFKDNKIIITGTRSDKTVFRTSC